MDSYSITGFDSFKTDVDFRTDLPLVGELLLVRRVTFRHPASGVTHSLATTSRTKPDGAMPLLRLRPPRQPRPLPRMRLARGEVAAAGAAAARCAAGDLKPKR